MTNETKRPRLRQNPTGDRLEALVDDVSSIIENMDISESRFLGHNKHVTEDRIILEGLKLLRREMNNNDVDYAEV